MATTKSKKPYQYKHSDDPRKLKFLEQLYMEIEQLKVLYKKDDSKLKISKELEEQFIELAGKDLKEITKRTQRKIDAKDSQEVNKSNKLIHNPKQTVNFLYKLTSINEIKYATHEWDNRLGVFNYENWLKTMKNDLFSLQENYQYLPKETVAKVYAFLLSDFINGKVGWGFDNIKFGWSSPELKEWCDKNPGIYPDIMKIPQEKQKVITPSKNEDYYLTFGQLINKFKREIQFRNEGSHLVAFFNSQKRMWGWEKEHQVHIDKNALAGLSFYVDVNRLATGIKKIFTGIKNRPEYPNVDITGEETEKTVLIKILHKGSKIQRTIDDPKICKSTLSGDFQDALNNLHGHCDWCMEGPFKNGKSYRIHYLTNDDGEEVEPSTLATGVMHTFTFYKPTV